MPGDVISHKAERSGIIARGSSAETAEIGRNHVITKVDANFCPQGVIERVAVQQNEWRRIHQIKIAQSNFLARGNARQQQIQALDLTKF